MPGFLEKEGHPCEKGTHLIPLALHFPQNNESQSTVPPGHLQILSWVSRPRGNKGGQTANQLALRSAPWSRPPALPTWMHTIYP